MLDTHHTCTIVKRHIACTWKVALFQIITCKQIGNGSVDWKKLPINRRNADELNLSLNSVVDVRTAHINTIHIIRKIIAPRCIVSQIFGGKKQIDRIFEKVKCDIQCWATYALCLSQATSEIIYKHCHNDDQHLCVCLHLHLNIQRDNCSLVPQFS